MIAGITGGTGWAITCRRQIGPCALGGMGQPTLNDTGLRLDRTGLTKLAVQPRQEHYRASDEQRAVTLERLGVCHIEQASNVGVFSFIQREQSIAIRDLCDAAIAAEVTIMRVRL